MIKYSMNYDYRFGSLIGKSEIFKILSEKEIVSFGCKVGLLRWKGSKKAVNYWYREIEVVEVKKVWNVVFPRKLTSHRASHFFYPFSKMFGSKWLKLYSGKKMEKKSKLHPLFFQKNFFRSLLFSFWWIENVPCQGKNEQTFLRRPTFMTLRYFFSHANFLWTNLTRQKNFSKKGSSK